MWTRGKRQGGLELIEQTLTVGPKLGRINVDDGEGLVFRSPKDKRLDL